MYVLKYTKLYGASWNSPQISCAWCITTPVFLLLSVGYSGLSAGSLTNQSGHSPRTLFLFLFPPTQIFSCAFLPAWPAQRKQYERLIYTCTFMEIYIYIYIPIHPNLKCILNHDKKANSFAMIHCPQSPLKKPEKCIIFRTSCGQT